MMSIPKWLYTPNISVKTSTYLMIAVAELALLLFVWWMSTVKMNPSPIDIMYAFPRLLEINFPHHLLISFILTLKAVMYSAVISLSLAYFTKFAIGLPLGMFFATCRFMGLSGVIYIFTMSFDGGETLKLSLLVFSMSVFLTTSMIEVVWNIPPKNYDLAKSLKLGPLETLYEVVILGTAHKMFDCLGQNIAISWMMLATVEGTVRSGGGIGILLKDQEKHFHLAEVFAMQIVILVTGMCLYYSIRYIKRAFCPYSILTSGTTHEL